MQQHHYPPIIPAHHIGPHIPHPFTHPFPTTPSHPPPSHATFPTAAITIRSVYYSKANTALMYLHDFKKGAITREEFCTFIYDSLVFPQNNIQAENSIIESELLRHHYTANRNTRERERLQRKRGSVPMQDFPHISSSLLEGTVLQESRLGQPAQSSYLTQAANQLDEDTIQQTLSALAKIESQRGEKPAPPGSPERLAQLHRLANPQARAAALAKQIDEEASAADFVPDFPVTAG